MHTGVGLAKNCEIPKNREKLQTPPLCTNMSIIVVWGQCGQALSGCWDKRGQASLCIWDNH